MMAKQIKFILVFVIICIVVTLGLLGFKDKPEYLEPSQFSKWVHDPANGLIKSKIIDGMEYRCSFIPLEYSLIHYPNLMNSIDAKSENMNTLNFILEIIPEDNSIAVLNPDLIGQQEYLNRLEYLNSKAQSDFSVEIDNKSIDCIGLQYENPFSLNRNLRINLEFNYSKMIGLHPITFIYTDNLLDAGILKFTFNKEDLNSIPKVKTKSK